MWIPPEVKDPICLHHPTRKSVGFFGAVRLRDGRLITRPESVRFDGQTCWEFLRQLQRCSRVRDKRVVVITDNARYHHSKLHADWRDEHNPDFQLHFLPPYSPQLNPIERVWKLTRRTCLHNQYFAKLECVLHAVEEQFALWNRPNSTLRRLCSIV
jgi:transposase